MPARRLLLSFLLPAIALTSSPSLAQGVAGAAALATDARFAPIQLVKFRPVPTPDVIPTDATPFGTTDERDLLNPEFRFKFFERLPRRFWFSGTVETSQRLDTNTLFTANKPQPDYTFRVQPNITVGYNFLRRTSVYSNYFVIKDVFADHGTLSHPTTQSLSLGFRQVVPLNKRLNAQFDFQARELWQSANVRQSDLLPAVRITHNFSGRTSVFGNALLQLRGNHYFGGANREIDPFYSVGMVHRHGLWTFLITHTYVTAFRNPRQAIPQQSNDAMILDVEISRAIAKSLPGAQLFMRVEPIWNWRSQRVPGLSGFDFRMFSGIRLAIAKPYNPSESDVKKSINNSEDDDKGKTATKAKP